ncbi:MAG: GntR family transcriptional regulator [Candidatus Dormibacteraceae bacterium]
MLIAIDESNPLPLYAQIAASLRRALIEGQLQPGTRLPTTRTLAEELNVNVHTVQRAYLELRDEGLLQLRQGRGAVIISEQVNKHTRLRALIGEVLGEAHNQGVSILELTKLMESMS